MVRLHRRPRRDGACPLIVFASLILALLGWLDHAKAEQPAYSRQFVTVGDNVAIEVLDWGGSGRALVLIAGIGADAEDWQPFVPKLVRSHHVYSVSRRGFGRSSAPLPTKENYAADRLGDDVLAVMEALKLDHPILIGHSFGGTELSSVGSRHPEKVAGLIYLDAGYRYAFDPAKGKGIIRAPPDVSPVERACWEGGTRYTRIDVPVLAIYAIPQAPPSALSGDPAALAQWQKGTDHDAKEASAQADAFEKGVPSARIVRIPHARHYVHESNEAEVLGEIAQFEAALHN